MAAGIKSVDVDGTPELLRLAEEVRTTGEIRLLRRDGEGVAVIMPVGGASGLRSTEGPGAPRSRRSPTPAQVARSMAGILASAGAWKELDAEALKAYIRERRRASSRPSVSL